MTAPTAPRCPKCYSCRAKSNAVHVHSHHGHTIGHLAHSNAVGLLAMGALWLTEKAINAARHSWKCACGHEFS